MSETILVSGGFDPVHGGHAAMIQEAANYGEVIVVVNSDEWLLRKKGFVFMPMFHRCQVLAAMKGVVAVYPMKSGLSYDQFGNPCSALRYITDDDDTVCDAIAKLKPDYFANGGDRTKENVPEQDVCDEVGTHMLWEVGGNTKAGSSSDLAVDFVMQYGDYVRTRRERS